MCFQKSFDGSVFPGKLKECVKTHNVGPLPQLPKQKEKFLPKIGSKNKIKKLKSLLSAITMGLRVTNIFTTFLLTR